MRYFLYSFVLICFLSLPSYAADISIGIVDTRVLMSESNASKDVAQQLQAIRDDVLKALSKQEKSLIAQEKKLIKAKEKDSESEFAKKVKDFQEKRMTLQKRSAAERKAINLAALKAERALMERVTQIVGALAKERKYDLVLTKQHVIVGSLSLDLTQEALERLNKQHSKLKVDYQGAQ